MREPRYTAAPCTARANASWLVYDEKTGRLVAIPLRRQNAYTLAHLLNVAELEEPLRDYGDVASSSPRSQQKGAKATRGSPG